MRVRAAGVAAVEPHWTAGRPDAPGRADAVIRGTVVDALSDLPVSAFTVSYHRTTGGDDERRADPSRTLVREAPDGRFSLRELPAGRW